jgi:drug/metabolite transporter (DMT)-like permease
VSVPDQLARSAGQPVRGAAFGLVAAALFGASAPVSKLLLAGMGPLLLAGLLYLGAGLGLSLYRLVAARTRDPAREARLERADGLALAGIVAAGGVVGPVLMLAGLTRLSGLSASLLLNLEAPFTILLAVGLFGEHLGRRAATGAALIIGGGAVLAWGPGELGGDLWGALALAGACLAWGADNNLTQRLSLKNPLDLVRVKTLAAGTANLALALAIGARPPSAGAAAAALALGSLSYGASILLDAYALRLLGAAREAAFFATAPFLGALLSLPLLGDRLGLLEAGAGVLMAAGLVALLRERHEHEHEHEDLEHEHGHVHDEHHQHEHEPGAPAGEPHSHRHRHAPLAHSHPHVPDAHHRHRHRHR